MRTLTKIEDLNQHLNAPRLPAAFQASNHRHPRGRQHLETLRYRKHRRHPMDRPFPLAVPFAFQTSVAARPFAVEVYTLYNALIHAPRAHKGSSKIYRMTAMYVVLYEV